MRNLRDALQRAQQRGTAIGHFNIADSVQLKAVLAAAQELNVPVLVGVSEGEREFIGVRQIAALVRSLREELDFPILDLPRFGGEVSTSFKSCDGNPSCSVQFLCSCPPRSPFLHPGPHV